MSIIAILGLSSLVLLVPFLIFLDFHKRSNRHVAVIYVVVFFAFWFVFYPLVDRFGLWLAASAPFALLVICIIARKKKS
jgi:hypothetical protein